MLLGGSHCRFFFLKAVGEKVSNGPVLVKEVDRLHNVPLPKGTQ